MFGVDYFAKKVIEYAFLFLSLQGIIKKAVSD